MKLSYKNRKLEKSLADVVAIKKNYGTKAKLIELRKRELQDAPNLQIMQTILAANCHELKGNLYGKLAVDISANFRIIFEPANDPVPLKVGGGLDWNLVTEIVIIEIGDYH